MRSKENYLEFSLVSGGLARLRTKIDTRKTYKYFDITNPEYFL